MITKHTIITYETSDGTIFEDSEEAELHELKFLYAKGGLRFLDKNGNIMQFSDNPLKLNDIYNNAEYIFIDKTKDELETRSFISYARYFCGWSLLDDIDLSNKDVTTYRMFIDHLAPIENEVRLNDQSRVDAWIKR